MGTRDQESKTVKFVYVTYVGPSVGGMAKGRVGSHKMDIKSIIGQSHVDYQSDDIDEVTDDIIREKLKKASGANYDLGSNAGGSYQSQAGGLQAQARSLYKNLEKDSDIGPVQFEKFARPKETPMDLGGRPMVAPPTAAKCAARPRPPSRGIAARTPCRVPTTRVCRSAGRTRSCATRSPPPRGPSPR